MIRFLQHKEIDIEKWDRCIRNALNGQIFVFSWYLDICYPGWCALVDDDYKSVFPLAIKNKAGINYLYQPFFTRHFGIFSEEKTTPENRLNFMKAIPANLKYWDFCLNEEHMEHTDDVSSDRRCFQQLKLNSSYSDIRKRYNENLLRNLKKAAKEEYKIIFQYSPTEVAEQFHLLQKNKLKAFTEGDYKTLADLMTAVTTHANFRCIAVENKNKDIIAGAFFMISNNRIVYLKGFSTGEGKKNGAMHFLFDQLIQQLSGENKMLDFGGSSVESVARFYKNFGAVDCVYLHLHKNRLPKLLRWIKR